VEQIYRTLREIFKISKEQHISTAEAADRFALERAQRVGRLSQIWVP
jgi:hypothetical protein